MQLYPHQIEALERMHNGCILYGEPGAGKSITALSYFYLQEGGSKRWLLGEESYKELNPNPRDLYIITTAKKRDDKDWEDEMIPFGLHPDPAKNLYFNKINIDSWNNIHKYDHIFGSFFIFDEQRVVSQGHWSKSFIRIAKANDWVLLTGTPGDTWSDYISVFVANGFYKNPTEFKREHIVYKRGVTYPLVDYYINTGRLNRERDSLLVKMSFERKATVVEETLHPGYDRILYKHIFKTRTDPFNDGQPILNASGLCFTLRKLVNSDEDRGKIVLDILKNKDRAIIFYSFNYELEILRSLSYRDGFEIAEWNGHRHDLIPKNSRWVYLVQYSAGSEGWNCTETNVIIFFSQTYSYKALRQAKGRIDRLNTPYDILYYYHLVSKSPIDMAINQALKAKKDFNERRYIGWKTK